MKDTFLNEANSVFAECGAFFRDTTLSNSVLAKYWPGVLLREPTFCDSSHRAGGFVAPHRYLIFSSNARCLDGIMPQPWGLCLWPNGRIFKVIDRRTDGTHIQLSLLEIPEHLLELFIGREQNQIEQAFIAHGRGLFTQYHEAPPVPELDTDEWRARLVFPVGVGDDGHYFTLYTADDYMTGPNDGEDVQEARTRRALVVSRFSQILINAGEYPDCDSLLAPAVQTYRSFPEPPSEPLANLLVARADLRFDVGDLKGAEGDLHDAFALRKLLSEDRLPVADVLSRLGHLYHFAGSEDAAERFYQHALKIKRRVAGVRSAEVLPTLVSLGALYEQSNRFGAAEECLREALGISADLKTEDEVLLNNLGRLAHARGQYDEALMLVRRSLALADARADRGSRQISLQANIAEILAARGDIDDAFAAFATVAERQRELIAAVGSFGSERQRLALLRTSLSRVSQCISLVMSRFASFPTHTRWLANLILDRKGLGADMLARERLRVFASRHPELAQKLDRLAAIRAWVAESRLAGNLNEELWRAAQEKDTLEGELASIIPEMGARYLASSESISRATPSGAVTIEYFRHSTFDFSAVRERGGDPWHGQRYLAIVLAPDTPAAPVVVDLGPAAPIDGLVAAVRRELTGGTEPPIGGMRDLTASAPAPPETSSAAATLRELVLDPLRTAIGDAQRLLLAPDGDLLTVPFGALPTLSGHQLIDDYMICYLSAARDLLRSSAASTAGETPPLVIAAPDYDAGAPKPTGAAFRALPGTRAEGEAIAELLGVRPLLGAEASKAAILHCRSPRVVHIATHGFCLEREKPLSADEIKRSATVVAINPDRALMALDGILATPTDLVAVKEPFVRLSSRGLENPLLRAGIALAGANTWLCGSEPPHEAGNGVLTAEEVTGLDLIGTELVVLSACDTGLGDVEAGEGVFGLRRSFAIAGARTLVVSLWKVPDEQTRELMVDFYRQLHAGHSPADALRQAQLAMRTRDAAPRSWAAFICQGDTG